MSVTIACRYTKLCRSRRNPFDVRRLQDHGDLRPRELHRLVLGPLFPPFGRTPVRVCQLDRNRSAGEQGLDCIAGIGVFDGGVVEVPGVVESPGVPQSALLVENEAERLGYATVTR